MLLAIAITGDAMSQEDSSNVKELGTVVITGQYQPQSVKRSVYQVKVITKERIQQQGASKLQDVLANELNLRFSQDLATGGSNINMMGLSGQNVKVLVDGVPMIGRQGTSNEININQVEVNSIERIEIIEGPMSVIYGADALGGVINIITKKPRSSGLSIHARLHEETIGKEYGMQQGIHNQYVGGSFTYKNWQVGGGIGRNLFNGWSGDTTGRELRWHKKDQITGNGFVGYRRGAFDIHYRFDGLDEIITNPSNASGNQPALDQEYLSQRLMQRVQAGYRFSEKLSAHAVAAHTHFTRQVYSTLYYPDGDVRKAPDPSLHSLTTFNGFTFRGTAVYKLKDDLSFQPGIEISAENGAGERLKTGVQQINDYAFFVTADFTPVKQINLRPGLRFIHNSVYQAPPVVASLNTRFSLTNDIDLRVAYARGFRAPSLRELYYDFNDASHSIVGNPDLKAERSHSFTGAVSWKALQKGALLLTATLNGFYNDIEDKIGYGYTDATMQTLTYINVDRYKSHGTAFEGKLTYRNLSATAGVAYVGFYNEFKAADKSLPSFTRSTEVNSTISWSLKRVGVDLNFFYKFTGKLPYYERVIVNAQTIIRLAETEGYHLADFTVTKKLFNYFLLQAGVRNLFDVVNINNSATSDGAHTNTGARPIAYGRSFFAGLVFEWSK
jgi:outer membrane receptor for ferrienterochelin and colicins